MAQLVKNLPVMQKTWETQVLSLGQEDLLEKEMATHASILAWRITWTEKTDAIQYMGFPRGCKESDTTERLNHYHQT